jgi:2-keto-4-pentenoate hydratase
VAQVESEARRIAGAFVDARRAGHGLAEYPGSPPNALGEAYAVQDAAIPLFGEGVAGWKVGRINAPWFEKLGVTRLVGPIFLRGLQSATNGQVPEGMIFEQGFGAAEAEFVFRIGTAPKVGQVAFGIEDAAALIESVFCGIEIASSPFSGINVMGPLVTISDFGNNNGLILGPEIVDWRKSDFEDWTVSTSIDGLPVGSGKASSFPGGPLESVRFLIENLVSRGLPVKPGLLVSSGAVTGVHEVVAGQKVKAQFGGFCSIDCTIGYAQAISADA